MKQKLFSVWAIVMALVCVPVLSSCGGDDDDDAVVAGGGSSTGGDNEDKSGGKTTSDRELIYPFLGWNSTKDEIVAQIDPAKWKSVDLYTGDSKGYWEGTWENKTGDKEVSLNYIGEDSGLLAVYLYYFNVDEDFFNKVKEGLEKQYNAKINKSNLDGGESERIFTVYYGIAVINEKNVNITVSHNIGSNSNTRTYILVDFSPRLI